MVEKLPDFICPSCGHTEPSGPSPCPFCGTKMVREDNLWPKGEKDEGQN